SSELLHAPWPMLSVDGAEFRDRAFAFLNDAVEYLQEFANALQWPIPATEAMSSLAKRYIAGELSDDDAANEVRRIGLYAVYKKGASPAQFIGKSIPPAQRSEQP